MAENNKDSQDFMSQLFDLQQQYLNNLNQAFNVNKAESGPSASPFEQWWSQFPKTTQPDFNDFFKNLSSMGMSQMQNPFTSLQHQAMGSQNMSDWFASMNKQFSDWLSAGKQANPIFEQMNQQFMQQMQSPFGASMFPGMQNFSMPQNLFSGVNSNVLQLMQNLFPSDEKNSGEQLLKSLEQYQAAMMQFNHMLAQVGMDSLSELKEKLSTTDNASLEDMYQWWMELSKQVFNREQMSEDYQKLKTDLEQIQKKLGKDVEGYRLSLIKNLGLVTRVEFEALQLQLDSLKQELAHVKAGQTAKSKQQKAKTKSNSKKSDKKAAEPVDDFTVITGIGAKFNEKLHEQGINNLNQLASLSDEMLKNLDSDLQAKGRVLQDQWREQAEHMLNKFSGKNED